jgi:hypothetical protein
LLLCLLLGGLLLGLRKGRSLGSGELLGSGWGRGDAVLGEEGEQFGFGQVEAEGFEGDFEFVVVD